MRSIQSDLFAPPPAWLRTVLRRLPAQDFLSVADVALAFCASTTTVTEWIEEGRLLENPPRVGRRPGQAYGRGRLTTPG